MCVGARIAAFPAVLALAACDLSRDLIRVPTEGARSVLLIAASPGGDAVAVTAIEVADGSRFYTAPVPRSGLSELFVLQYACPLPSLGLTAGEVQIAEARAASTPIVPTQAILHASIPGGVAPDWQPATALPQPLAQLRLRGDPQDPCVTYEASRIELAGTSTIQARVFVPLDASSALVSLEDGRFFRAARGGVTRLVGLSTTTPHLAGAPAADGDVWLLGENGAMAKGHPDRGFLRARRLQSRSGRRFAWLVSSLPPELPELFALTDAGAVEHFDGGTWRTLAPSEPPGIELRGSVAWIAPGEALVVRVVSPGAAEAAIERFTRAGTHLVEPLPLDRLDAPSAVALLPGFGVLTGSWNGNVIQWRPEGSTVIPGAPFGKRIRFFAAVDDGFMAGGGGGNVVQYHPGHGWCPLTAHGTDDIAAALPMGDDLMMITANEWQQGVALLYLTRTSPPPATRGCARPPP